MNKLTNEEIILRLKEKYGNEYDFLSEYKGVDQDITIRHNICGNIWTQTPYNFFKSKGCTKCRNFDNSKMTQEEFIKRVYELYGEQYTVLGKYINSHTPILILHNYYINEKGKKIICNGKDKVDPSNFLRRKGKITSCKTCRKKKNFKKYSNEENDLYKFCVYKHVNKNNQKVYIGITSQSFHLRWNNGYGYIGSLYFYKAIQKDGWNNFEHFYLKNNRWIKVDETMDLSSDYEMIYQEATKKEIHFINYYKKKLGENNVYNITDGGEGSLGINLKSVKQYSVDGKFINQFSSIKEASIKTNISYRMISACCNGKTRAASGYIFKFVDDDSPIIIPKKNYQKNIPVQQYSLSGTFLKEYVSATEAHKKTGISNSLISACCNGKYETAGNYQWKYKDSKKKIKSHVLHKEHTRKVLQYDLKGNFIKEWETMSAAKKVYKIGTIYNSCANMQPQAGGYIWLYKDNEVKKNLEIHLRLLNKKKLVCSKKVYKFDKNGNFIKEYKSLKEAANANNVNRNTISKCCYEKTPILNDYIYSYRDTLSEIELNRRNKLYEYKKSKKNNKKIISQYNKFTGEKLKTYNSIREAAKENNILPTAICACCNGRAKSAGGFVWKYENIKDLVK